MEMGGQLPAPAALPPTIEPNPSNIPVNPLNADLNSIRHLLALLGAYHILHVSRIRVNSKYHDLYT